MAAKTRTDTRQRLLDAAQELVNHQGFAATSIDQILERVGVTKGAFFHHFKTKNDLARALIERFAAGDQAILHSSMERAEKLSADPLQQLLIFVGLMLEVAEQLDASEEPGCLFATYCYERGLFDRETEQVITHAIDAWRERIGDKLRAAAESQPPAKQVDFESLAEMITILLEGAFVLARTNPGRRHFTEQMRHYRNYLQLLFGA